MQANTRKGLLAAITSGILIVYGMLLYVQDVKQQLWEKSLDTAMEVTSQGANALHLQLAKDYEFLQMLALYFEAFDGDERIHEALESFQGKDGENYFCVIEGEGAEANEQTDQVALEAARKASKEGISQGIVDSHISAATGRHVFDLYVKMQLSDGKARYIFKEYQTDAIAEMFSLSFYNHTGFSYIANRRGDILIRSPHVNSNKTFHNVFDLVKGEPNDSREVEKFQDALGNDKRGWASFVYNGQELVFCYFPLLEDSGWHLVSIIPKSVMDQQTQDILSKTLLLLLGTIICIGLLACFYLRNAYKSRRQIENQANFLEHLYQSIPEGVYQLSIVRPFCVCSINREGLRLLGYDSREALAEKRGGDLASFLHPNDVEMTSRLFEKACGEGGKIPYKHRILRGDGSFFWAGGIVEKTSDIQGKDALIVTFSDITEEKLREQRKDHRHLLERSSLMSAISSAYPLIVAADLTLDQTELLYRSSSIEHLADLQGDYSCLLNKAVERAHGDFKEKVREKFGLESLSAAFAEGKKDVYMEMRLMWADGRYHWISMQAIHVENSVDKNQRAILLFRGIDEQKHEEEQRRQVLHDALDSAKAANQAKSWFLSNMSHDIRTPMSAIVGMTVIAGAHLDNQARVKDCLNKISISSRHLISLINDVLDMSKIESGKMVLNEEAVLISEFIGNIVEILQPQAQAKELEFEVMVSHVAHEHLEFDQLRLNQVFLNILSNAVKFTMPGGQIELRVEELPSIHKNYARFQFVFSDTGKGMTEEFLKRLFDPFSRAADAIGSVEGTGLGLAITKNIIDLMNGAISVKSKIGEGTAITLTLDLKLQAREEAAPNYDALQNLEVLAVDDDIDVCENISLTLAEIGVKAEWADCGARAVEKVKSRWSRGSAYDVIVIDWKMPEMNGIETTRRIREIVGDEVSIIVLTAYDWSEIEEEARQVGVDAFMSKPFFTSDFYDALMRSSKKNESELIRPRTVPEFGSRRILLAEDNLLNVEIAEELLSMIGIEKVDVAKNGQIATDMFADSPLDYYSLVFMDVQMPMMNGYEATRAIRRMERADARTVPIVAMTANAFSEDIQNALDAGMTRHLAKPLDIEALSNTLKDLL